MPAMLTAPDVIAKLRARFGSAQQKDAAAVVGVSPAYFCDIMNGRREPAGKVLEFLGLERRVYYARRRRP